MMYYNLNNSLVLTIIHTLNWAQLLDYKYIYNKDVATLCFPL